MSKGFLSKSLLNFNRVYNGKPDWMIISRNCVALNAGIKINDLNVDPHWS